MKANEVLRQLEKIWEECFGTDESYFEHFAEKALPTASTFIAIKDKNCPCLPKIRRLDNISPTDEIERFLADKNNEIVSSLHVFPMELVVFDRSCNSESVFDGGYLYGVATLPEWRKRGYATLLIEEAAKSERKIGMSYFITRPAEPNLIGYYCKLGFTGNIFRVPESLPFCESLSKVHSLGLDASQLYFLRENTWKRIALEFPDGKDYKRKHTIDHTNSNGKTILTGYFRWTIRELEYILSLPDDSALEPHDTSLPYALLRSLSPDFGLPPKTVFSFPME
ncbi:MAG: GNAT family N-acetyltransferase [Bacteroidales bacterium]|jgi:ribosomal protein S18 acetylase RimI-like enzyme|nr:GNAT family N-acetyltransferase [Bacteroidales bacterium]MCI2122428.1 GNAT family N-acetyltransferase [Bacteroidales bacterium]MCI2145003.1 GNAT family N-acetyltransferase [Bacteroidales bacterium]